MPSLPDRFAGCLLGLAVGDAFAAPFEGVPDWFILAEHGLPEQFMRNVLNDPMRYTDDTEMMAGALCGALGGLSAVPYVDKLEDGERGRTHIRELGTRLAAYHP